MRSPGASCVGDFSGPPAMFPDLKTLLVELNTPVDSVFAGLAEGVEPRTAAGAIAINPQKGSYLNLTETTRITLRAGTLTVLAEDIRPVPSKPVPIASHSGLPEL